VRCRGWISLVLAITARSIETVNYYDYFACARRDGRWEFGLAGGSLAASDRPGLTLLPRSQTLETDKNGWSMDQACGSGLTKAVAETWVRNNMLACFHYTTTTTRTCFIGAGFILYIVELTADVRFKINYTCSPIGKP